MSVNNMPSLLGELGGSEEAQAASSEAVKIESAMWYEMVVPYSVARERALYSVKIN
jgi:hypothetical protein